MAKGSIYEGLVPEDDKASAPQPAAPSGLNIPKGSIYEGLFPSPATAQTPSQPAAAPPHKVSAAHQNVEMAQRASRVAQWARQAGWSDRDIPTVVAIAMAESGGDPLKHNANDQTKDDSFGLMQINYYGKLKDARYKQFGSPLDLVGNLGAVKNLKAAKTLHDEAVKAGRNPFGDWSTYTRQANSYKNYLGLARVASKVAGYTATDDQVSEALKKLPITKHAKRLSIPDPTSAAAARFTQTAHDDLQSATALAVKLYSGKGSQSDLIKAKAYQKRAERYRNLAATAYEQSGQEDEANALRTMTVDQWFASALNAPITTSVAALAGMSPAQMTKYLNQGGTWSQISRLLMGTGDLGAQIAAGIASAGTIPGATMVADIAADVKDEGARQALHHLNPLGAFQDPGATWADKTLAVGQTLLLLYGGVLGARKVAIPAIIKKFGVTEAEATRLYNSSQSYLRQGKLSTLEQRMADRGELPDVAAQAAQEATATGQKLAKKANLYKGLLGAANATPQTEKPQEPEEPKRRVGRASQSQADAAADEALGATTGVNRRIFDEQEDVFGKVAKGVGKNPEQLIRQGRQLIKAGIDPVTEIEDFERTGNITPERMAVLRAQEEILQKQYQKAVGPEKTEAAKEAINAWRNRIRPVATKASDVFRALQGRTVVDTGDFISLRDEYQRNNPGKEVSPSLERQLRDLSDKYTDLEKSMAEREQKIREDIEAQFKASGAASGGSRAKTVTARAKAIPTDREGLAAYLKEQRKATSPAPRPGGTRSGAVQIGDRSHLTPQNRAAIWRYANENYIKPNATKEYGEGLTMREIAHLVATDLDENEGAIQDVFAGRKSTRVLTDQQYREGYERRKVAASARELTKPEKSLGQKVGHTVVALPEDIALLGHAAGTITHAGPNVFDPKFRRMWVQATKIQDKAFFNPAAFEEAARQIERSPYYNQALRLRIGVDPDSVVDEYQEYSLGLIKPLGKITRRLAGDKAADFVTALPESGSRSWIGLKWLRMQMFEKAMSEVPQDLREDVAPMMAEWVRHATGQADIGFGRVEAVAEDAFFAPKLEASRWSRVLGDAYITGKDLMSGDPARIYMAKFRLKRAMRIMKAYTTILALNSGLQMATQPRDDKHQINFLHPSRRDFLMPKIGDKYLDITGNVMGPLRFIVDVIGSGIEGFEEEGDTPGIAKKVGEELKTYLEGKFNPLLSLIKEGATRKDFSGRLLPWASPEDKRKVAGSDRSAMEWPEWLLSHSPIAGAEMGRAYMESAREEGVPPSIASSMFTFALGWHGARVGAGSKPNTDWLGGSDTGKTREDPEIKELKRIHVRPKFTYLYQENRFDREKRLQAFHDFAAPILRDEFSSGDYKSMLFKDKQKHVKKLIAELKASFEANHPDFYDKDESKKREDDDAERERQVKENKL